MTQVISASSSLANLKLLDESITQEAAKLKSISDGLHFLPITEFELNQNTGVVCDNSFYRNGVYFFEINNKTAISDPQLWGKEFDLLWSNRGFKWHSGLKHGRLIKHSSFEDWIPLYIGKSRTIGKRINEHILQPSEKTTFSMKLKATPKLHGLNFRVSWIPLDVLNYDMIVPALERLLRDKYNPVIGKQ